MCIIPTGPITINEFGAGKILDNKIFKKIPLEKIAYYIVEGEVIRENKISGGGGGGSTVGGAVVGGLIAGDVGAIIGSRGKVTSISSQLITHDTRKTVFYFYDDNNEKQKIVFDFESYEQFRDLLPEKTFEVVNAINIDKALSKQSIAINTPSLSEQIRELGTLRDEGLLTDEEFKTAKRQLLKMEKP